MQSTKNEIKPEVNRVREIVFAVFVCILVLLVPMIYIEYEYRMFIQSHGEAIEGAAGSALALAVVFRTVSRTVSIIASKIDSRTIS